MSEGDINGGMRTGVPHQLTADNPHTLASLAMSSSTRASTSRSAAARPAPSPSTRVLTVGGYASWADQDETHVFTRMDQHLHDDREVVPYSGVEYPSHQEVSSFWQSSIVVPQGLTSYK